MSSWHSSVKVTGVMQDIGALALGRGRIPPSPTLPPTFHTGPPSPPLFTHPFSDLSCLASCHETGRRVAKKNVWPISQEVSIVTTISKKCNKMEEIAREVTQKEILHWNCREFCTLPEELQTGENVKEIYLKWNNLLCLVSHQCHTPSEFFSFYIRF